LEEEATQYGDLVVLPGAESYFELPLKTLELLGYALRSPCNFTHVLKTDDDVYVRPDRLLRVLEEGEFEFSVPIRAPADARTRFDGLYSGRYLERRAEQLEEEARRSEETRQRLQKFPRVPGARPLATAEGSTRAGSVESRPSVTAAALQSEIAQRSEAARRLESAQQPDAASFTPEIVLPSAYHEVPDPVEGAAQHTLAQALSGARLALSRRATRTDVPRPWMQGVFVGQLDTNKSDVWPGWIPDRDSHHKWYLSEDRLSNPDARSLLGTRWISGWGYLLSRDVAQAVRQQAEAAAWNLGGANGGGSDSSEGAPGAAWRPAASPALSPAQRSLPGQPRSARPEWWGRLPWEDVLVAALAEAAPGRIGELFHHGGFKPAWNGCDSGTVLKHLDNDAPRLMQGLHAQQVSGLWDVKEVVCSTGHFQTAPSVDQTSTPFTDCPANPPAPPCAYSYTQREDSNIYASGTKFPAGA
ncbi:hypothetical protein H632_c2118p0, partial [Helicosporidium sp. ATCC 50920]